MEPKATITGICPRCDHTIEVPGELEDFSCVYCGIRLRPADLRTTEYHTLSHDQQQDIYVHLRKELPAAVTSELGILKYMTKDAYSKHYSLYLEKYREIFTYIPQLSQDYVGKLSADIVTGIDQWAVSTRKGLATKATLLEEAKFTLCLLTIPAIRSLGHIACEDLAHGLQRTWCDVHPGNTFQLTTYEEIMSGFKPRKLCYISTAVCRQAGKPDDCPELMAFRDFRDGYLTKQPEGAELIARYYDSAPGIVMSIDLCGSPETTYPLIWKYHLLPCYEALLQGKYDLCQQLYTRMMEKLPQIMLAGWSNP